MQLEALSNSIESSINYADRVGLDRATLIHFWQLLKQFDGEVPVFLSCLQSSQSRATVRLTLRGNEDHGS
jgi:hypothetical protein